MDPTRLNANLDAIGSQLDVLPKNLDHQLMIRALFGTHFVLTAIALLAPWPPNAFIFYNAFLLGGYLWLASTSTAMDLALQKCAFVEIVAIPLDVLCIALYYNSSTKEGIDKGALVACAAQVIVRFAGIIALRRIKKERPTPVVASSYENVASQPTAYQEGPSYQDTAPKTIGDGFSEINRFAQQRSNQPFH
uniref:Golgi apparatus membrane protein TVP23 n=1 Tax=Steinernema glaseri TaxID=37863 RepID=A0A1I7Z878_9BILA